MDRIRELLARFFYALRTIWPENSGDIGRKAKLIFDTTSDQFLEKAQETRRAVKLRMAIMDVEHSLNRVYTQIGKLSCDVARDGVEAIPVNGDLAEKLELAREYRQRLEELRKEQESQQRRP
ncbi:MAG: hypothetical protein HY342_09395 [Candidatus Lambdaproteobacteria bacterium]|nr:hypothetical protein [Candidatus Lambdaproteobacteria bacterium]